MPIFNLSCAKCAKIEKRLLAKRPESPPKCPQCGGDRVFDNNMASIVLETFDNGFMVKKVQRLKDIEELRDNRQKQYLSTKNKEDDIV